MNKRSIIILGAILCAMSLTQLYAQDIIFKGDLRMRYQLEDKNKDDKPQRVRGRVRARLGAKIEVNPFTTAHLGFASGDTDPRSTNETFGRSFSTKKLRLDYAYANMTFSKGNVLVGKMKNPLWRVSDLMWDSDITPEGVGFKYKHSKRFYVNGGYFVLEEISDSNSDPYMIVIQPGLKMNLTSNLVLESSAALYSISNVRGVSLYHTKKTNALLEDNTLAYNPNIVSLSSMLTMKKAPLAPLGSLSFYADYLQNTAVDDYKEAYLAGIKVGNKKVKNRGQWNSKVQYRHIKQDATLDIFPDSDSFGGATGIKGLELIATVGVAKNMYVSFDYYANEKISGGQKEKLFQIDWVTKF